MLSRLTMVAIKLANQLNAVETIMLALYRPPKFVALRAAAPWQVTHGVLAPSSRVASSTPPPRRLQVTADKDLPVNPSKATGSGTRLLYPRFGVNRESSPDDLQRALFPARCIVYNSADYVRQDLEQRPLATTKEGGAPPRHAAEFLCCRECCEFTRRSHDDAVHMLIQRATNPLLERCAIASPTPQQNPSETLGRNYRGSKRAGPATNDFMDDNTFVSTGRYPVHSRSRRL